MKNYKNLLSGIAVGLITFAYWLFIMTIGDTFRLEHPEYRSEITFGFIISAIIVNLISVYVFYSKSSVRDSKSLFFIVAPYLLMLVITELVSLNIPRALDIAFIVIGSYLIYEVFRRKLESYKPILILGSYIVMVSLSYTFLFNLIENATS